MAGIVGDEMGSPKSELSDEKADNSAENTAEEEPSLAANEASTNLEASTTANDANDESEYETLDEDDDDDDDDNNEENSSPVIKPSKLRSKESDDDEDDGIDNENDEDDDDDDGSLDSRRQYSDSSIGDDLSDDIVVESERLDGDGQEKEIEDQKPKKLDDDEDRRNPQYIPKKGTFYEHDDRTCLESDDTAVNSTEPGVDSKSNDAKNVDSGKTNRSANRQKQVWTDKASGDKWHHDLYVEDEQSAKTPQELIDTYGYDIRSEEAPPKARRRRKYGRFYSKYDRDWENESAYKSGAMSGDRRGRTRNNNRRLNVDSAAEFPALNNKADSTPNRVRDQVNQESQQQRMSTTSQRREATFKDEEREDSFNRSKDAGPLPTKSILKMPNSSQNQHSKTRQTSRSRSRPRVHANSSNDGNAPAKDSNKEHVKFPPQCKPVDVSSLPKHVRGRGYFKPGIIPGKMEFTPSRGRGRRPAPVINSGYSGMQARPVPDVDHRPDQMMSSVNSVTQNLSKLEIAPAMPGSSSHESKLSNMIELHPAAVSLGLEKRIQNESPSGNNRSKRFSTQRQRSLPETNFSSPPAVVNGPAAPPTVPPPIVPPPVLGHDPTIGYYPTTQPPPNAPQVAPVPQNTPEQFNPMVPVPDYPPPPVFNESVPPPPVTSTAMPPPPQMVAFLPPGPPPPGPPPVPPPTAAPPFPPPSIINYVPTAAYSMPIRAPPVQQEVYQGQNGITYYSPQSQAAIPRQTPSRRKKVAIPIVPPPDQQGIVAMSGVMMSQPPPQCPPQLSQMPQSQTATVTPVVTEPGSET